MAEKKDVQRDNIFSKTVRAERRSFFLDVRENDRGRFLKLTESSYNRRSTILISGRALGDLIDTLQQAINGDYEKIAVEENADNPSNWTTLLTKRVPSSRKRIYFDLKQNSKGKVFSIAELSNAHGKTTVMIPEASWTTVLEGLVEVQGQFGEDGEEEKENVRVPRQKGGEKKVGQKSKSISEKKIQTENKRFFFDYLENEMGRYLKLSESRGMRKDIVYLPSDCLEVVIAFLKNMVEGKLEEEVEGLQEGEEEGENAEKKYTTLVNKMMVVEPVDPVEGEGTDESAALTRTYIFQLRENDRGRFLRLGERKETSSKVKSVFIPDAQFEEMANILQEFLAIE